MVFDVDLAEKVEQMATEDTSCCGFMSLTTHHGPDSTRLEMHANEGDAVATIRSMVGLAAT